LIHAHDNLFGHGQFCPLLLRDLLSGSKMQGVVASLYVCGRTKTDCA
jgi:hypothetical protein